MEEFRARLERMQAWRASTSYGLGTASTRVEPSNLVVASVAFVETLYPESVAGQTTLEDGVDPEKIDSWVAVPPSIRLLDEAIEKIRQAGDQRHLSQRRNLPEFETRDIGDATWGNKPVGALYTSSSDGNFPGMWCAHLAARDTLDDVHAWRVARSPAGKSLIIRSAIQWCEFSIKYSGADGIIQWQRVADEYSRVCVTALAVARIDCFEFAYRGRTVMPVFWGVETTVWLRAGVRLLREPAALSEGGPFGYV